MELPGGAAPRVFLDYDQAALDAAYNQAAFAPNLAVVTQRYVTNSAAARRRLGEPERRAYGSSAAEFIELYRTRARPAPVFAFFHGGAWKAQTTARYDFIVEPFVQAGAHVALVEFCGVEEAGGDLGMLAAQVRRAIAWLVEHAKEIGADPARIVVGGHSSGAHLAAVVATTLGVGVAGVLCCSGIYDLLPVSLSSRNAYVRFDGATIDALSPQRHAAALAGPAVLAYGTFETPEFQRQPRAFAEVLAAAGKSVSLVVGEGYNHFELVETLANPCGVVGRAALELLGLAG